MMFQCIWFAMKHSWQWLDRNRTDSQEICRRKQKKMFLNRKQGHVKGQVQ